MISDCLLVTLKPINKFQFYYKLNNNCQLNNELAGVWCICSADYLLQRIRWFFNNFLRISRLFRRCFCHVLKRTVNAEIHSIKYSIICKYGIWTLHVMYMYIQYMYSIRSHLINNYYMTKQVCCTVHTRMYSTCVYSNSSIVQRIHRNPETQRIWINDRSPR